MHELALCERIIQIVGDEARGRAFSRVKAVWLEIAALSQASIAALRLGGDSPWL